MPPFYKFLALFIISSILTFGCHSCSNISGFDRSAGLNIYNWSTYIAPEIITEFEKQNKIKIYYKQFESNEELYENLKPKNPGYDVIFPTDYMIEIMTDEGMLQELNLNNIPNLVHIDPKFLHPPYDPNHKYSVPYQWGTLGIGYNIRATGTPIVSWSAMFAPQYIGKTAWLDNMRYTMGAILIYLGFDPNTTHLEEINQARDLMIQNKQTLAAFAPDTGQFLLDQGDVSLAFEWSGDIFQVMANNPDLRYVIPEEGTIIWIDNMAIPKDAPHLEMAERFINFILAPEVGAKISNFTHYASPNQTAIAQGLIDQKDLQNLGIYPSPEIFNRLQYIKDVGAATTLYEKAWTEAKAGIGR